MDAITNNFHSGLGLAWLASTLSVVMVGDGASMIIADGEPEVLKLRSGVRSSLRTTHLLVGARGDGLGCIGLRI